MNRGTGFNPVKFYIKNHIFGYTKCSRTIGIWFKYAIIDQYASFFSFAPFLQTCNYWIQKRKKVAMIFLSMRERKKNSKLLITVTKRTNRSGIQTAEKPLKLRSSRWNAFYTYFDFYANSNRDSDNWGNNDDNDEGKAEAKWKKKKKSIQC